MTNQKARPGQAQMTKRNEEVFCFTRPARRTTLAGGSASFQGQNCATLKGRTTEIAASPSAPRNDKRETARNDSGMEDGRAMTREGTGSI
jgi:hypothetical protein